jgi:rhodanese-related sulfurtransferase
VWVVCDVGTRASMAANLLRQAGFEPVVLAGGGVPDLLTLLARRAGAPLGSLRL